MDRRIFLKTMGIAATGFVLPGQAAELIVPSTTAMRLHEDPFLISTLDAEQEGLGSIIKIVGVGYAGGYALEHMISGGVQKVEFVVADTDAQALARSSASTKLLLDMNKLSRGTTRGLDTAALEAHREEIRTSLAGAHLAFIVAGMGGVTGAAAASAIAEVAKGMDILTVGVVTLPFSFEGNRRKTLAEASIIELGRHVDSLVVIPLNMFPLDGWATWEQCFSLADNAMKTAVGAIADIITYPGLVGVDFEDVRTVMCEMGHSRMSSGIAAGVDRAHIAAAQAMTSPLINDIILSDAKGVLVNISGRLKMKEVNEVMNAVKFKTGDDAHIIFGAVYEESLGDALRVTVIATGLGQDAEHDQRCEGMRGRIVTLEPLANKRHRPI